MDNSNKDTNSLSRRDFLKAAGIGAAGLMVSGVAGSSVYAAAPGKVIGANDRINIGHIGVGGQGGAHINFVKGQPADQNVKSVAVCDLWDKRRLGAATATGVSQDKAYEDYRKLLDDKDVDAVIIATPEHWHAKIAVDALDAGKHVYCEKPMCRHLDEIHQIQDAVKRSKLAFQVGSQGCSDAKWSTAGAQVKAGKIGKIVWSQGSYCRNSKEGEWEYGIDADAVPGKTLDWVTWTKPVGKVDWNPEYYFRWRKWRLFSAGILSDLFPHRLHPLMIATGLAYPTQVTCIGSIVAHPDRDVADTTQMLVKFPDGSQMVICGSTANEQGIQDMIRGHKATIYFGGDKVEIRPERWASDEIEQEDVPVVGPGEDIAVHERNWFHCIRTGDTPNCNIELAARVQTIITLADESWRQNKTMNFDVEKLKVV